MTSPSGRDQFPIGSRDDGSDRAATQAALAIVIAFTLFRCALAAGLGLGVDEAYGLGVAHELHLSYFDHPPLHYWIANILMPLTGDGRLARLPFILLFAGTGWLLYLLTRRLFGAVAGALAVLALNLSAFFTLAGGWVLPDGPLLFALLAATLALARHLFPAEGEATPSPWATWLQIGFWLGIAGLSKYHAALYALGLLAFFATMPRWRSLLLHPAPWAGALLALVMVSPVIIWNMQHDWASIAFQAGRGSPGGGIKVGNMLANIGGQFIWMFPWIFVPMVIAAWYALREGRANERSWLCLSLALPTVLIFTLTPLWGERGLPHWQMPGWLMLYPVLGDYLAQIGWRSRRVVRWASISTVLLVALAGIILGHAATGYGRVLFPAVFAKGDPTLEALEWTGVRDELNRRGLLDRPGIFIVTTHPIAAGKIDQAISGQVPVVVMFGETKQYGFRWDPASFVGRDAIVVGREHTMGRVQAELAPYFESIEELPPFSIGRSGMAEMPFRIFLARHLRRPLPVSHPTFRP